MPQNFAPHTILQNETLIKRPGGRTAQFSKGVFNDLPKSEIPAGGIVDSVGYIPFADRLEPCGGVAAWSAVTQPYLKNAAGQERNNYTLSKVGDIVTRSAGDYFTPSDVGNAIFYPIDSAKEYIIAWISPVQVQVDSSATHTYYYSCGVVGKTNGSAYHRKLKLLVHHLDTRLFVSDINVSSYVECVNVSCFGLANSESSFFLDRDSIVVVNENGWFRLNLAETPYLYWPINSSIPAELVTAVAKTIETPYGYKYTYSAARISGNSATRNRKTSEAVIEQESGTCQIDENGFDYAAIYQARPIGDESTAYSILTGGLISPLYRSPAQWAEIVDGQFGISINGTSHNAAADFSDVKTMADVAARLQAALRVFNSVITVEYSDGYFVITNDQEGSSLGETTAGSSGTDIGSSILGCQVGYGTVTTPPYTASPTVGDFFLPVEEDATSVANYHITHIPVYRSLDIGKNGIDPITGEGNNEEQFVWVDDVPVAKAFIASAAGGTCIAPAATFQPMDEGSKLRFSDGTEVSITAYVDPATVQIDSVATIESQAAAIGGDDALGKPIRVGMASQTGYTVTRTAGLTFSLADVGKMIFWANGRRSHISGYIDANNLTAAESLTIHSTGICMDPRVRKFCDTVSDETLRGRIENFSLSHRFWEPMPTGDCAALAQNFIFSALAGTVFVDYGQIPLNKEYLIGYHNPEQRTTIPDSVVRLSVHRNGVAVYCEHSTHFIASNTYQRKDINGVIAIYIVSSIFPIDEYVGLICRGAVTKLPDDTDWLVTSEPAIRIFDGNKYSDNLAEGRIMNKLREMSGLSLFAFYDPLNGVSLFGRATPSVESMEYVFQDTDDTEPIYQDTDGALPL